MRICNNVSSMKYAWVAVFALALVPFSSVLADEHDDALLLEVVDDENAGEEDFVDVISLPDEASDVARERSAFGIETANEARERGRDFGQERADRARELGREASEARGRPEGTGSGGRPTSGPGSE